MTNQAVSPAQRKAARIAGFLFLFTFAYPTINFILLSKYMVMENAAATAGNIIADGLLFRVGIVNELVIAAGAIVFGFALYVLFKPVNGDLALLAFSLKTAEAVLFAVLALGHFIALLVLDERASLATFAPGQIQALAGVFINLFFHAGAVGLVFHGLNSMLFLYLFIESGYVPRTLAVFGLVSYALVFIYALIMILFPGSAKMPVLQTVFFAPSILAELMLGIRLISKGVVIRPRDAPAPGPA